MQYKIFDLVIAPPKINQAADYHFHGLHRFQLFLAKAVPKIIFFRDPVLFPKMFRIDVYKRQETTIGSLSELCYDLFVTIL